MTHFAEHEKIEVPFTIEGLQDFTFAVPNSDKLRGTSNIKVTFDPFGPFLCQPQDDPDRKIEDDESIVIAYSGIPRVIECLQAITRAQAAYDKFLREARERGEL